MSSVEFSVDKVLVFKTNLKNVKDLKVINAMFKLQDSVYQWSVDLEDIDRVLRLETSYSMKESSVIELLFKEGIVGQEMTW